MSMRGHRTSGKTSRTMLWAPAISIPPPRPCSARPATRTVMLGAVAQTAVPTTNTAAARTNARRIPARPMATELPALPSIEAIA